MLKQKVVADRPLATLNNINILIALDENECFRSPLLEFFINLGYPDLCYCSSFGTKGEHLIELLLKNRTDLLVTNLVLRDKKIFPALLAIYTDPEKRFENLEIIIVSPENRLDSINTVKALSLGRITEWVLQKNSECFPGQKMQEAFNATLVKITAREIQKSSLAEKRIQIKNIAQTKPEIALGLLGNNLGEQSHELKLTALRSVEELLQQNEVLPQDAGNAPYSEHGQHLLNQVGQILGQETEYGGATENEKQELREALAGLFCKKFNRSFVREQLEGLLFRNILSMYLKYYILGLLVPVLKEPDISSLVRIVVGEVFSNILKNVEPPKDTVVTISLSDYTSLRKTLIYDILKKGAPDGTWLRLVQQIAQQAGDPLRPEAREALEKEKQYREAEERATRGTINRFVQLKN